MFKFFIPAFNGILHAIKTERNVKIHLIIFLIVLILSNNLHFIRFEKIILWACFGLVVSLELMNTAIEKLCNFIEPNKNETIKIIKDISAGSVLVAAISSVIIGSYLFIPKILHYWF